MFRFHGDAVGAAGRITNPYEDVIPAQASAALPEVGGVARAQAGRFDYHGILRFEEARAELTGTRVGESNESLIMAAIEGLNISGIITADRIVAHLVSSHRAGDDEPEITPIGSSIENLRIAGRRVEVDLATDMFHNLCSFSGLTRAFREDAGARDELREMGMLDDGEEPPEEVREYLPARRLAEQLEAAEAELPASPRPQIFPTTLVRRVRGLPADVGKAYGNIIHIYGFGLLRLAEFNIARDWKRLTMMRVKLGGQMGGELMAAAAQGNGSDW
jgi:hypothetical protein